MGTAIFLTHGDVAKGIMCDTTKPRDSGLFYFFPTVSLPHSSISFL